ncbi:type II toxin-antitoxin system RelB family antitoxin [Streptococcus sp. CL9.43]|jgi:ribbon-helix-helix protein, copG family|uniref:type II toxin-antitoxin system RelB family antitoxin n=1 Tax=Streptococcus sp. CL9.43 TaxID=3392238 RepID=UPI003C7CED7E
MNNIVTTPVSVRFSQELNSILSTVVEENNTTKTDFIRQAVVEKIEDMYDIRMADQAHKEWVDGGRKTISHEEMMKRYG